MLTQIINGHILTPQGWMKDGSVLISDGKILEVTNSDLAVIGAKVVDAKGMSICPRFRGDEYPWRWGLRLLRMYGRGFPRCGSCSSETWGHDDIPYRVGSRNRGDR